MWKINLSSTAKRLRILPAFGSMIKITLIFGPIFCFESRCIGQVNAQAPCYTFGFPESLKKYAGIYNLDDFNLVDIRYDRGNLLLRPLLWNSTQILEQVQEDSFVSHGHANLRFRFFYNSEGAVRSVKLYGFEKESGDYKKIKNEEQPLKIILSGDANRGTPLLVARHMNDTNALIDIGVKLNLGFCTKYKVTARYLEILSKYFPNYAPLYAALGNSYMLLSEKAKAITSFQKSLELDPHNTESITSLQLLQVVDYPKKQVDSELKLPFPLSQLFRAPTGAEIKNVEKDWSSRDLSPKEITIVDSGQIDLAGTIAQVYILSHLVYQFKHYGVVILPNNSLKAKRPIVMELKGVNALYAPFDVNHNFASYQFLCGEAAQFIYIAPSYRGEKLVFKGKEYLSEGDRTDAYDGTADDAICFLSSVIHKFPEVDQNKIAVFGKSRGGTVALLSAIRDKRIKYVLDWAGPVDWFNLMDQLGFTQQEFAYAGLINHSSPFQIGGQFIEWFLIKSIKGQEDLAMVRRRLIASSPLYFLDRLPIVQAHYGIEDGIVPMINGLAIQQELNKRIKEGAQGVFFHSDAGHDLDPMIAFEKSRDFLLQMLKRSTGLVN
jgi:tetratricopeptide (TPR) repeat protein